MRELLMFVMVSFGVYIFSTAGFTMEMSHEQSAKRSIHHSSVFPEGDLGEPPLKKCKNQKSDNNPLLFSVMNLTPDAVDYYLSAYQKSNGSFYDDYEKSIQPKAFLHHVYLNDHPELILSNSQLVNHRIFPNFTRRGGSDSDEYTPTLSSTQFSWGRLYILCPIDVIQNGGYVSKNIKCFISSDFPEFKRLMYLFSTDENCPFNLLPPELKLEILSKTFMICLDKPIQFHNKIQ